MALLPWRKKKNIKLSDNDQPFGDKAPPANFGDHTTILGSSFPPGSDTSQGQRQDDEHESEIAKEHSSKHHVGFIGPPEHKPPPNYIGPPEHKPPSTPGYLGPPITKPPVSYLGPPIHESSSTEMGGKPIPPTGGNYPGGVSATPIQSPAQSQYPSQWVGPPVPTGDGNNGANPKPFSPPAVSLGGEGIVMNGGVTNPLEQKPDQFKSWGSHELADDALGLSPHLPDKPQS